MFIAKIENIFLLLPFLLIFTKCGENMGEEKGLLWKESLIVNKYQWMLTETNEEYKKAENLNNLQAQLDLKRKMDDLMALINEELKSCAANYPNGKTISFKQTGGSHYKVLSVFLLGCRVNQDLLIETHIVAKIRNENSRDNFFPARLVDNTGKTIEETRFSYTNDFPESKKTVTVISHPENFSRIKNFKRIVFQ